MKILAILSALVLLTVSCSTKRNGVTVLPDNCENCPQAEYSPSTIIVSYDPEVGKENLVRAVQESCAEIVYDHKIITAMTIRKPHSMTLDEAIGFFGKVKGVVSVEKDYIYHVDQH